MGKITIYSDGSFQPGFRHQSRAIRRGHTAAILDAVSFLMGEPLLAAIEQDAKLRAEGCSSQQGFEQSVSAWLDVFEKTGSLPSDTKQSVHLPAPAEVGRGRG